DGAVLSDRERKAGIGVTDAVVLDVGALAELDPFIVAAQHRTEPDAGAALQAYLADDSRGIGDEIIAVGGKIGPLPVQFVDRHAKSPFGGDLGTAEIVRPAPRRRAASSGRKCRSSCSRSRRSRSPSSRTRSGAARSGRRAA